ncbi:CGG triplet repeat-binding protein 1 [Rhizophagus clarus]|uniref:CGG triplet repeat-binding protein 1 n=1 Tax=Rhizophagus clarus TaxID=94130 RepID=A0A8H3LGP3_9GLOM|nr:CGG triplet repeat-binding protein 1 [Rhizophagus clarus]
MFCNTLSAWSCDAKPIALMVKHPFEVHVWEAISNNDLKHTFRDVKSDLETHLPGWVLPWLSYSPDLNPIKNVWAILKKNVEKKKKWDDLDNNVIVNCINSMQSHIEACIDQEKYLKLVNNSTMGSTLLTILTKYNIPFSLPRLFISDSAAYMKKCFREVLKPVMPQLIHAPCCIHILNLIGKTWQKFNPFAILKEFLAKIKECFVCSPARRECNCNSQDFGSDLDTTITLHYFNPLDFYPVFRSAFEAAFNKFNAHIPSHPTRSLFQATQIFDPKYILLGPLERKNLHQYSAIRELANPSDELLCEWSIYCELQLENSVGEINLEEYWMNLGDKLPILSKIALDYIWLPVSSCSVERSFSIYNNILDENRQNLSEDSLKRLNMMYFNGN